MTKHDNQRNKNECIDQFGLPDDSWFMIRPLIERGLSVVEERVMTALDRNYGVPRDLDLIRSRLSTVLPPGRLYIYGAGTHTLALIDAIQAAPGVDVQGLLDRRADELGMVSGLPVLHPSAIIERNDYDYVLLSHLTREAEMTDALITLGVPANRIVPVYSNSDLLSAINHKYLYNLLKNIDLKDINNVIVRCDRSVIIEEHTLSQIFDPDHTLILFMVRPDWAYESRIFRSIDTHLSVRVLTGILRLISPQVVYLSTILEFDALSIPVRQACPNALLVHEVHDWWNLYDDDTLQSAFDLSPQRVRLAQLGEYYSTQRADLVVSNRDGPLWARVQNGFSAPYLSYFVGFPDTEAPLSMAPTHGEHDKAEGGKTVRLLYAGNLPPPHAHLHFDIDFTFLSLFEEMAVRGDVLIHIFNNGHKASANSTIFSSYQERFAGPGAVYHPRIPAGELLERMASFDFGWHCMPNRRRLAPDQAMAITHRFTGYLRGGLPVIIDSGWRLMADLVREHGAGIVLDDPTAAEVVTAAQATSSDKLRVGVASLTAAMRYKNCKTIEHIISKVKIAHSRSDQ